MLIPLATLKMSQFLRHIYYECTHDTERAEVFKEGAHRALAAVRAFLSISSHVSDTIEITDLRQFINQIDC